MRNIKEESEANWNYILILDEFLTYFHIISIKEFSLISRFLRNKLKAKLFAKSAFNSIKLLKYFDTKSLSETQVDEIYRFFGCIDIREIQNKLIRPLPNNSELIFLAKDLKRILQRISGFIKSLTVLSLPFSIYEFYPITFTLDSLVHLELIDCYVPLLKFMRIGEYLKNLVKLSFESVTFIELNKQELSPETFHFPCTVKHLKIYDCHMYIMNSIHNFTYLNTSFNFKCIEPKLIQGFNILNLKRIEYYGEYFLKNLFFALLKSSPQVETLIIGESLPEQRDYNQISISKYLTNLELYCAGVRFPHISDSPNFIFPRFDSVNKLTLGFKDYDYKYDQEYRNITNYFPNLTHLTINIGNIDIYTDRFGEFFDVNLSVCNTLEELTIWNEELRLEDSNYYDYKFNFVNFLNVKYLILDLDMLPLSQIDFNNLPSELKHIRKLYCVKQYQLDYIRDNPVRFMKWNIEFKDKFIYFTK